MNLQYRNICSAGVSVQGKRLLCERQPLFTLTVVSVTGVQVPDILNENPQNPGPKTQSAAFPHPSQISSALSLA